MGRDRTRCPRHPLYMINSFLLLTNIQITKFVVQCSILVIIPSFMHFQSKVSSVFSTVLSLLCRFIISTAIQTLGTQEVTKLTLHSCCIGRNRAVVFVSEWFGHAKKCIENDIDESAIAAGLAVQPTTLTRVCSSVVPANDARR